MRGLIPLNIPEAAEAAQAEAKAAAVSGDFERAFEWMQTAIGWAGVLIEAERARRGILEEKPAWKS